jgi:spore coat protein U-like protein
MLKLKTFIWLSIMSTVSDANSACENMRLTNYPSHINLNTNNFQRLDLEITKGEGSCDQYYMTLDNGNAGSSQIRSLQAGPSFFPIQFYKDNSVTQILKSEFEASASDILSGSFSGNTQQARSEFYVSLKTTENRLNAFGNYTQSYNLKLFEGPFGQGILRDQKNILVNYLQSRITELSLVPTGSIFNRSSRSQSLDFGQLTEGSTRGFDIVMLHNAGYSVSINSLNGGKLKHETKKNYVIYQLTIDGSPVRISTQDNIIKVGSGISSLGGTRLPVFVRIGDATTATVGTYTDIITINVASTE